MSQKYLEIQIPENIVSILEQCVTVTNNFNFQRFDKIKTQETDDFLKSNHIVSNQLFKIWHYHLPGVPLCLNCNKRLEDIWINRFNRTPRYCCHECQVTDPKNSEKQKETWKNKTKQDISVMMDTRKLDLKKYM